MPITVVPVSETAAMVTLRCSGCALETRSVSDLQPEDPAGYVDAFGWSRDGDDVLCVDCVRELRPGIGVRAAPEHGVGVAWVTHTCTCGLVRGGVLPYEDTYGAGWPQRCLDALGGGGTIFSEGRPIDVCPSCFEQAEVPMLSEESTNQANESTSTTTSSDGGGDDLKHPLGVRNFTRNLRVKLTDREIVERAQRACALGIEIEQKNEEIKAAAKLEKAKVEELEAERRRLDIEVNDGATYREVACQEIKNWRLGEVVEIRTDTKETLTKRPMSDRERQVEDERLTGGKPADAVDNPLETEKPKRGRKKKNQADASSEAE